MRYKISIQDPITKEAHVIYCDSPSTMHFMREHFLDDGRWVDVYDLDDLKLI